MTSPPDVQNVPDIWRLLEDIVLEIGHGALKNGTVRRIIVALTQRNRFVLVSKDLYEHWRGLCLGVDWNEGTAAGYHRKAIEDGMRALAVAKPEGKP